MKKIKLHLKVPAVLTLAAFIFFSAAPGACAQMPVASETTEAITVKEGVQPALPGAGNVTVNFKDVDIKTVLHYLSEVSGVDIVPSPGVEGPVTMRLRDKPWEVALDIVTRNYGYAYSSDDEKGIIRVMPRGQLQSEEPVTEVIPLNHIVREIQLTKKETEEQVLAEMKEESIDQLLSAINSILDTAKGEKATFIASANALVVTAIPARISDIKSMVAKIDKKTPQVMLDAKVVEIQLNDDERFGIDWNAVVTAAGAARPVTFPFTTEGVLSFLPDAQRKFFTQDTTGSAQFPATTNPGIDPLNPTIGTPLFTFGTLDFSSFTATLQLLEQRGDTEILSCPRVTTLNNQKADIKVVDKLMLQKSETTTQSAVAGILTVEFETEDEAREVGVMLTVIPHVNEEGDISVNLLPEVSTNAGFQELTLQNAAVTTLSLTFQSREANTTVRVQDGETIFIGGLIRKNVTQTDNKLPILGDLFGGVPVLGNAFRYEAEDVTRSEIVFFVTVHLIKDGMDSIKESRTEPQYDIYCAPEKEAKAKGEAAKMDGSIVKVSAMRPTEKTEVVEVAVTPMAQQKRKAWLDFRKK